MTELIIDLEGDDGVETQMQNSIPATPLNANLSQEQSTTPTTGTRVPRVIVESTHLAVLVSAYTKFFAEYSKNRKNVTQLVPSLVWKDVYDSYKKAFPNSNFVEDTLKDRLRETLKDLKTGTSNQENTDKAVLQDDDIMTRLKATDGHASRNVLRMRNKILNGESVGEENVDDTQIPKKVSPSIVGNSESPLKTPPKAREGGVTKAKSLHDQASRINAIAKVMRKSHESRDALMQAKLDAQKSRDALVQAQLDQVNLANLKTLLECRRITQEFFNQKTQDILDRLT